MLVYLLLVSGTAYLAVHAGPASDQVTDFKHNTSCSIGILTTSNGAPVEYTYTSALNSPLIPNEFFMGSTSHFSRERIPVRIVHAKGAGAFGHFTVTHDITEFCKADLFSEIGKQTPVVVRFSPSSKDKGAYDTSIDSIGFAVKFFTKKGNFDIVGFHTPMFMIKDPLIFQAIARLTKRNPVTNTRDSKLVWDVITAHPESAFFFLYLFGDNGIPDGFRYMPGFSIHTYQVYNKCGKSYFIRFHILPDLGIRNLFILDALKIAAKDPDYFIRDLYDAIASGNFPTWTVYIQVLSCEDVENADFDIFDITRILPLDKYPLRQVGILELNKNPDNFFADVEQTAFCPCHLVPGILGGPDRMFAARRNVYRDAQLYRLGVNFNKIRVNCPIRNVYTYMRDGVAPVGYNGGDAPSYLGNTYNGPVPIVDKKRPELRYVTHDKSLNFDQAANFYTNEMTEDHRGRTIANIVSSLSRADPHVQRKAVRIFKDVHHDLGTRIAAGLKQIQQQ